MPSRDCFFASCISSRSVFIDHPIGLRAILAVCPTCLRPPSCWLFGEFQRSYSRTELTDLTKCVVTVLSQRQIARRRQQLLSHFL